MATENSDYRNSDCNGTKGPTFGALIIAHNPTPT